MTEATKITNKERYAQMASILGELGHTDLVEFCERQIAALETKAAKAKERAAAKAAEPDALLTLVAGALTGEFQSADAIFEAVEGEIEDTTVYKVRARLTALVHDEVAEKEDIKVEDEGKTRTVKGYRLVG